MRSLGISVGKAFKNVGLTVGTAAGIAALYAIQDPKVLAPLIAAGPYGAIAALVIPLIAHTVVDQIKHRGDTPKTDGV